MGSRSHSLDSNANRLDINITQKRNRTSYWFLPSIVLETGHVDYICTAFLTQMKPS